VQKRKNVRGDSKGASGVRVVLTAEEAKAVVDACTRQKQTIPTYLTSRQSELAVLNSILEKLAPGGQ